MNRLKSIDALRGFVMVIMLIDHIRETFYLHLQVSDPVDVFVTNPDLFYTRFVSSICAPVFIWLTGVSAWLFMQKHSTIETSKFLLKRGIFLVLLEVTLITFLWSGKYPPDMFFLQVIWCIGVCMIALSGIIFLRSWQILLRGITIVCGHNLIGGFELDLDSIFYIAWAILYQREVFDLGGIAFRTSYPILPWIGVIALGFISGPWFSNIIPTEQRQKMMLSYGFLGLFLFLLIRFLNFYGDHPWINTGDFTTTLMSFLSLTKYPPSLLFNLSMLSLGFLFLYLFEKLQNHKIVQIMSHFGAAPMFFYVLHLFVLQILYKIGYSMLGPNQGQYLSFPSVSYIWFTFIILTIALYFPTKWFAQYKQANKHIAWLKYF
jgi:uncharacterized membrane protein